MPDANLKEQVTFNHQTDTLAWQFGITHFNTQKGNPTMIEDKIPRGHWHASPTHSHRQTTSNSSDTVIKRGSAD